MIRRALVLAAVPLMALVAGAAPAAAGPVPSSPEDTGFCIILDDERTPQQEQICIFRY